jgi:hypothetical protein
VSQASVIVTLKTAPISEDVTITLDPTIAQSDPSHGVLKVQQVQKDVDGELEIDTTGTKIVGDKAKGKVTIYNATASNKTFPAGTVLSGPNGLKFTTDVEVTIASSSGSAQTPQPGTGVVAITANTIGTESNLGGKNEFLVANFDKSTYVASNEEAFSGGSSREIQAVAKEDLTKLETQLTKQLKQEALDAVAAEQQSNARIIPVGTVTVKQKVYDAKVGDEAKTLKLNMTMTAQALQYSSADLVSVAAAMLQSSLTSGSVLREEKTQIDPGEVQQSLTTGTQLQANLSSEIIPAVDKTKMAELIKGRTIEQALSILKDQKEVGGVEIMVTPKLAELIFSKIPSSVDHISIQTKVGSL